MSVDIISCEHGTCPHKNKVGDNDSNQCIHMCSLLAEQNIFDSISNSTYSLKSLLAQIFSIPNTISDVVKNAINKHNLINAMSDNVVSIALFRYAVFLVAKSLGATLSDWIMPLVVSGSDSKSRVQQNLDQSESGSTLFASIILGIAIRNRELALEFITFALKHSTTITHSIKYNDESDVFKAIIDSVKNEDKGATLWSIKVSSFACDVFSVNRHLSWIQSHPEWITENPKLDIRSKPARKLVELLKTGKISVTQFINDIKKTTSCVCGVSWSPIILNNNNTRQQHNALICVTYRYCGGTGGCGICVEY